MDYIIERKDRMMVELDEIILECRTLIKRCERAKVDLEKVHVLAQAIEFDETHDLEEGLKHITLF